MVDRAAVRLLVATLAGWLTGRQQELIAYLIDENRILRAQLGDRRVRSTDAERCRLAVRGHRLDRKRLSQVATIVTPDTILRWHRQLIARKWTDARRRPGRPGVRREIHQLIWRLAEENPTWGYSRIQGALKNVGHRVARSTIARVLKASGLPPVPERPTSWQTFLRAHWGAIAGADLFTTEVWTWRGLVTCYTVFVIDLASRRVQILGGTPHPDAECLNRIVPLGDRHLRQTMHEFVAHDHGERNHQGIGNELINRLAARQDNGRIGRRQRLGGPLDYCFRAA